MLVKRIVFTVRRKSNPSLGVGRLFETITVKMTNGETKAGADRLAQEIAYALEEHFDEPSSIKWELDFGRGAGHMFPETTEVPE